MNFRTSIKVQELFTLCVKCMAFVIFAKHFTVIWAYGGGGCPPSPVINLAHGCKPTHTHTPDQLQQQQQWWWSDGGTTWLAPVSAATSLGRQTAQERAPVTQRWGTTTILSRAPKGLSFGLGGSQGQNCGLDFDREAKFRSQPVSKPKYWVRPDLQNILRLSYDNAKITIDLWRRLIYHTSYEERKAFLRYNLLAKS